MLPYIQCNIKFKKSSGVGSLLPCLGNTNLRLKCFTTTSYLAVVILNMIYNFRADPCFFFPVSIFFCPLSSWVCGRFKRVLYIVMCHFLVFVLQFCLTVMFCILVRYVRYFSFQENYIFFVSSTWEFKILSISFSISFWTRRCRQFLSPMPSKSN